MQNIQKLYQDLHEGKISRNQFLFQIRKDSRINSFFTSANSYDETVRILKNRGLLFEIKINEKETAQEMLSEEGYDDLMKSLTMNDVIKSIGSKADNYGNTKKVKAYINANKEKMTVDLIGDIGGYYGLGEDELGSAEDYLKEAKEPTNGVDQSNPYELEKGIYYEMNCQKDGAKDTNKAKEKALKNLNKNPKYYSDLFSKNYNDKSNTSDQMQIVKESLKNLIDDILS